MSGGGGGIPFGFPGGMGGMGGMPDDDVSDAEVRTLHSQVSATCSGIFAMVLVFVNPSIGGSLLFYFISFGSFFI